MKTGKYEIRIDEQTFHLSNPEPTGRELLALIGKAPDKFLLVLVIPDEPDRLIDPDETVNLEGPGTEQFTLVTRERYYSFRINEQSFSLPNRLPNGRELMSLVGVSAETHLLSISLQYRDDELIDPDETVDLAQPGREQFFTIVKKPLTIIIDDVSYVPAKKEMTGKELRHLPKPPVSDNRDLWLDVPGKDDLRIDLNETIALKDNMVFYTAPSTINPGVISK